MSLNTFEPSRDHVLAGCAILPAPAVPASTRISARLKCVQEHVSPVNLLLRGQAMLSEYHGDNVLVNQNSPLDAAKRLPWPHARFSPPDLINTSQMCLFVFTCGSTCEVIKVHIEGSLTIPKPSI